MRELEWIVDKVLLSVSFTCGSQASELEKLTALSEYNRKEGPEIGIENIFTQNKDDQVGPYELYKKTSSS